MKKHILIFLIPLCLCSCIQNEFQELLLRTANDPTDCILSVDSLASEDFINISWKNDPASDMYILLRANDAEELEFKIIYEGTENSFHDVFLEDYKKYVYRLDKKRGNKTFHGSHYGYGFSIPIRRDAFEPNDGETHATLLESDRICNLPYALFMKDRHVYIDEDWFKVSVPPHRTAEIVVSQDNITANGKYTNMYVLVPGKSPAMVIQDGAIELNNPSDETSVISFKLYPNVDNFNECLSAIEYVVKLYQIIKY